MSWYPRNQDVDSSPRAWSGNELSARHRATHQLPRRERSSGLRPPRRVGPGDLKTKRPVMSNCPHAPRTQVATTRRDTRRPLEITAGASVPTKSGNRRATTPTLQRLPSLSIKNRARSYFALWETVMAAPLRPVHKRPPRSPLPFPTFALHLQPPNLLKKVLPCAPPPATAVSNSSAPLSTAAEIGRAHV